MNDVLQVPPHNMDAELSTLGIQLIDPAAIPIIRAIIPDPKAYYLDTHQSIQAKIFELADEGIFPDVITASTKLLEAGLLKDVGGSQYLEQCVQHRPRVENAWYYAEAIAETWERRKLIAHYQEAVNWCYDPTHPIEETLSATITTAKALSDAIVTKSPFAVMTSAELDAADLHTEYLVDGIFAAKQPCILAASKKSLKTTLAIDLALALSSGAKFLNQFYVLRPVRVALMSGESGDAVIQETARRIARSKPWINLSDYTNCLWSFDLPKLGHPQTKATLTKFITDNSLDVLIVDPAYLCLELGDDAGNLFAVGPKLLVLSDVMRETGCTIIIIHHTKKAKKEDQYRPPELEDIAWSGFQEWARQWILLGRREAYDPEQSGSHRLWLSVGGSAGHSGLWGVAVEEGSRKDTGGRRWEISVEVASTVIAETIDQIETAKEQRARAKEQKQLEADVEKLIAQLKKHPKGDTAKVFAGLTNLPGNRIGRAVGHLRENGLIEEFDIKKNNRAFPAIRLISPSAGNIGNRPGINGNIPTSTDGEQRAGITPLGGIPVPAHRDIEASLFEKPTGTIPNGCGQVKF